MCQTFSDSLELIKLTLSKKNKDRRSFPFKVEFLKVDVEASFIEVQVMQEACSQWKINTCCNVVVVVVVAAVVIVAAVVVVG